MVNPKEGVDVAIAAPSVPFFYDFMGPLRLLIQTVLKCSKQQLISPFQVLSCLLFWYT